MRNFADLKELAGANGQVLGTGEWLAVTQEMIDRFAEATGDFQYIHVDPERAAKGPFGTTIAHGFLTLSLIPRLAGTAYKVGGIATGINYGSNRVRFIEPVRVNSRIRVQSKLLSVEPGERGTRVTTEATVQLEGSERPACVAEIVTLLIPA
jgi:acyl dehydratase